MIADLGNFALMAALVFSLFGIFSALYGSYRDDSRLMSAGYRSVGAVFFLVSLAMGSLWYLILNDDFRYEYIASHSNVDLPLALKIGSLWSGQQGSLLLWTWMLTVVSTIAVATQRTRHNRLLPVATAVMLGTATFFLYLNNFSANPFEHLVRISPTGNEALWGPADGRGLNPLLQHWAMVIHPPILYMGYIGFVVPFAFAIAALWTRQLGSAWVVTVRRFTLISWALLGTGIILGAKWAYVELGWGGYWGWDPVENASLMPWLAGTAYLHSVIVQEKRGMLKVWNIVLICLTYWLCILGTALTRTGAVTSVHSFAASDIGTPFTVAVVGIFVGCALLIVRRLPYLRSENKLDSLLSRESGFLFNNLLLLAATFSVLFGVLFPIFSEAIAGSKVSVGQAYFNKVEVPLGLLLLALVGVGPLLSYRKTSTASLRKNFMMPVSLGLVAAPIFFILGVRDVWPLISLTLCVFVTLTIVQEFHKGTRARMHQQAENYALAMLNLTRRNNRRYGGYIVHFGIVLVFLGVTGSAFVREGRGVVGTGDEISVGPYRLQIEDITERDSANYYSGAVTVAVYQGDKRVDTLHPERRVYHASQQPTTEVDILQSPQRDLYLVFQGFNEDQTKAVLQAYVNPLVMWLWVGGLVIIMGTLVCLLPDIRAKKVH